MRTLVPSVTMGNVEHSRTVCCSACDNTSTNSDAGMTHSALENNTVAERSSVGCCASTHAASSCRWVACKTCASKDRNHRIDKAHKCFGAVVRVVVKV